MLTVAQMYSRTGTRAHESERQSEPKRKREKGGRRGEQESGRATREEGGEREAEEEREGRGERERRREKRGAKRESIKRGSTQVVLKQRLHATKQTPHRRCLGPHIQNCASQLWVRKDCESRGGLARCGSAQSLLCWSPPSGCGLSGSFLAIDN